MKGKIYFLLLIVSLLIGRNLEFLPKFSFSNSSNANSIKKEIKELIEGRKGNYSVYFSDLNSKDMSFGINENTLYTAASLNKLPIVAVLYQLAKKEKINLDEKITVQQADIQDYGSGSIRYEEGKSVYSLKTLAKLSLEESDNTAAHILANKIGMNNVQKIIDSWGLKQTDMMNNKTSAFDIFTLFKKIYQEEVTTPAFTKEILDFLKDTYIEDRLPNLLPKNTIVYHKTGDSVGRMHDAGIIKNKDTVFFLGVLTSDIGDNEKETQETISQIAKKVFDLEINRR